MLPLSTQAPAISQLISLGMVSTTAAPIFVLYHTFGVYFDGPCLVVPVVVVGTYSFVPGVITMSCDS